ncbi:MAG TPA: TolC family outer membrane protein [Stellaceae bacterium]|nr:TolC family outer membrane protein [Stellaceae bacterium]
MPAAPFLSQHRRPYRPVRILLSGAALSVLASFVGVGAARADNLGAVLADAYNGNAAIQSQRYTLRQTDEQVPQALSGWRPKVELTGQLDRQKQFLNLSPASDPHEIFNQTSVAIQVTQPLYSGGETVARTKAAEATVAAGQAQLSDTEQNQLLLAAQAYLDTYRDQSDVALSRNLQKVLTVNLGNVDSTFKAGAATETDTSQAQARLSGANASVLAAEGNLAISRASFRQVVGRDPQGELSRPALIGRLPATEADAEALAISTNPAVLAARQKLEAAKHEIDVERAGLLPKVNAVAGYQNNNNYLARGIHYDALEAGVQASIPLYESGSVYSGIRAAKEAVSAAQSDVLQAERTVRQQVSSAWNSLRSARAQQQQYRDQIRANEIALNDTMKEVSVGTRTRLDTLNAEQELFSSRVNLVGAEHDTLLASFRLEAATGAFTPQGLSLDVKAYDPKAHLNAVRDKWIGTGTPK